MSGLILEITNIKKSGKGQKAPLLVIVACSRRISFEGFSQAEIFELLFQTGWQILVSVRHRNWNT